MIREVSRNAVTNLLVLSLNTAALVLVLAMGGA